MKNDNENKTNAPIKLPVRYDETTFCVHDTEKIICVVDVDATMPDNLANALGNQIVAALNEADALRAEAWCDGYNTRELEIVQSKIAAIKPNAAAGEEGTE